MRKVKLSREEEELEKKINILEKQLNSGCNNVIEKIAISIQSEEKTRALEKIVEYKTKGAILMAKCRWYKDGEYLFPKS